MAQISHSRVETFVSCPYKYKLRYLDNLRTVADTKPDNALYLGTALHTGLETGDVDKAVKEYFRCYPVIDNEHIVEEIKLRHMLEKTIPVTPQGLTEVKIDHPDFVGYIDLLVPALTTQALGGRKQEIPNTYDLYDFKYSNHLDKYMKSPQLHLYKYFFEKTTGKHIRDLYYIVVPKVNLKRKWDEDENVYRKRVKQALQPLQPQVVRVPYEPDKVVDWLLNAKQMLEERNFNKNQTYLCNWCEYQDYCTKGDDTMILPSSERRQLNKIGKRKIWIYGAPFSGKTTMLDDAPNPLNINTDGNITYVTMPYVAIKDEVTVTGRISDRKWAWEVLEDTISELEKKQNDFKTIIVDLLEDTYNHCRLYVYHQLGVEHESDAGFGKGWEMVRVKYLAMIKRILDMDYENITLVSHVDTSRDIMKKNGNNITKIAPALQEKISNKIAGMVDIVARVVVDGDTRTLNFKSDDVVFGGGRLKDIKDTSIPLDWQALMKVFDETVANANISTAPAVETQEKPNATVKILEENTQNDDAENNNNTLFEETPAPVARVRRRRGE